MSVKPRYISFGLDVVMCCIKELLLLRDNLSRNCRPRLSAKCEKSAKNCFNGTPLADDSSILMGLFLTHLKVVRRRNEHIGHLILKTAACFKNEFQSFTEKATN